MRFVLAFLPRVTLKQAIVAVAGLSMLGGGAVSALVALIVLGAMGGTVNPPAEQPIPFDHTIHAGKAGIACEFCHRGVETQAAATIPSVQQCMFCHGVIATDRPGVQLLRAAWETDTPIEWRRVHRLPDHVRFVHEPHISAGVACETCHGQVAEMTEVRQVRSLNMGDCMNCHRESGGSLDCATCHK